MLGEITTLCFYTNVQWYIEGREKVPDYINQSINQSIKQSINQAIKRETDRQHPQMIKFSYLSALP